MPIQSNPLQTVQGIHSTTSRKKHKNTNILVLDTLPTRLESYKKVMEFVNTLNTPKNLIPTIHNFHIQYKL